jgi:SAM-dependent methyltransferase
MTRADEDAVRSSVRDDPDAVWHEVLPLWNVVNGDASEQADVGHYLKLVAASRRPVVELGVGYGRMARWTRPDYGVDQSASLLLRTTTVVPGMTVVTADLRDYLLSRPAALSYASQNVLCLLGGPDETMAVLANIRRNTAPRGQFAFDVAVPHWDRIRAHLGEWRVRGKVGGLRLSYMAELLDVDRLAGQGSLLMHHAVEHLDSAGEVTSRIGYPPVPVYYYTHRQWHDMLARTGWRVRECLGGFSGEPLTLSSKQQVWLVHV